MEQERSSKGKVRYYILSLVPVAATLLIQVASGLLWSIIASVMYVARLIGEGKQELLNDPQLYEAEATAYIMDGIIYAVVIAQIITLIGVVIWYGILVKKQNLNRPVRACVNGRTILMCICLGVSMQFVIGFFLNLAVLVFPDTMQAYSELIQDIGIGESSLISVIATVILAPISEELLFRGLTLRFLNKTGMRFLFANIIQAALFGFLHMNIVQGLYAFVIGLVLGCVAGKCRTVFLPIMIHLIFNLSGVVLGELPVGTSGWLLSILFFVGGCAVLAAGFFLLKKETASIAQKQESQ